MAINITRGDLLRADVEAIVNTVSCVGVMGKGIATADWIGMRYANALFGPSIISYT